MVGSEETKRLGERAEEYLALADIVGELTCRWQKPTSSWLATSVGKSNG
jgi:hypothetical protein